MKLPGYVLGKYRSSRLAIVLCILLAVAALACGTSVSPTPEPCSSTPDPDLLVPTPTPKIMGLHNITWRVPPSLEEQIYRSDVIARASLLSATANTVRVPSDDDGVAPTHRPVQELVFKFHEYLQGNGPDEAIVVVWGRHSYLTEAEACSEADRSVATRNTQWDEVQGALFLIGPLTGYRPTVVVAGSSTVQTFVFNMFSPLQSEWDYSVDTLVRAWLPAQGSAGRSNTPGQPPDASVLAFITDGAESTPPVITLADLRTAIAEMAATLKAGEGIEGYARCISGKILHERINRADPGVKSQFLSTLTSGSAAKTQIYKGVNHYREPKYSRFWPGGPDAELFQTVIIDDDTDSSTGYEHMLGVVPRDVVYSREAGVAPRMPPCGRR